MALNYIMIPENIQRRPLPGHRHRPKKDKKVDETFTPVSRAGRRVLGEAKVKTANNAKKDEERSGLKLFNFVKKLNRFLAARPTPPGGEQTEVAAAPKPIATTEEDVSGSLPSQLPQKRPMTDSPKSSTSEVVSVKRARSNAISSSSRMKVEDIPRPPSIVDSVGDTVSMVGNGAYDSARQSFTGEQFHQHDLVTATDTVQQYAPFLEHAVHDIVPPPFPDHPAAHQLANQPNLIFPEHEAPNWPAEPFWLNAHPAPGFAPHNGFETRNDVNFELERVAIACAYAGMGEPMDIDPEFPTFIPNDTYADLDLERVAIACAYAGMDEPMDTTLDDTRGPVYDVVPQGLQMFDQPGFAQYLLPQHAQFELGAGIPLMYQTVQHLEHQYFVDQDQRLQPPIHIYPVDQPFQQEYFVMNQLFPPHLPAQANVYPVIEEYFPAVPPFDVGHGIHVQADVPIPLLPTIHDQPVNLHHIHEEVRNQPDLLPVATEMVGHNERTIYQDVGEAERDYGWRFLNAEVGDPDRAWLFEDVDEAERDYGWRFLNAEVGDPDQARLFEDVGEAERDYGWRFLNAEVGDPDQARFFEDLSGTEDVDDDDDDDNSDDDEVEVIIW